MNTAASSGSTSSSSPAPVADITLVSVSPSSGTAGEPASVTLNGKNFQAGSQVKVGGSAATDVTVIDSKNIKATFPAMSAGVYTVQVIAQSKHKASLTNGFTYKSSSSSTSSAPKPLSISTSSLPGATAGQSYSTTLKATGGKTPYAWSILSGSLTPGLTLTAAGKISGTPTSSGQTQFSVEVQDSAGTITSKSLTLQTASAPNTTTLPAATLTSVTPADATADESIAVTLTGANFQTGSTVKVGGDTASGITVVNSTTIKATLPAMVAGIYTVQVISPDASVASLTNAVTYLAPLRITTSSLPQATVGQKYTATLQATGGLASYSWSLASGSLPSGLFINSTGTISGTPSSAATSNFTAQVKDATGETVTEALTLDAVAAPPPPPSGSSTPSGTALSSCANITASGTYYLAGDVTCTTRGFSINANNVTLNLNGHTVTYGNSSAASAAFMVCDSWYAKDSTTGVSLSGCSGSGNHQNLNVYGGTIVQASGAAPFSPVFWIGQADGLNGGQIHNLTATFSSTGSQFIHTDFPGVGWNIHDNVINDKVTNIQLPGQDPLGARSEFQGVAIDIDNSGAQATGSGNTFQNNTINGSPQGGIRDTSSGTQYLNNTITLSSYYSNDYGIVMYADNQTASGNTIQGRGRGIDAEYSNFTISSNQITVHEEANNSEYSGCELQGGYGIRVKNYAPVVSTGGMIENNTVTVSAAYCQATALEFTDLTPAAQITVSGNTFTTTSGSSGQIDAALGLDGSNDPQITYAANTFKGTYDVFCGWDGCGTTIQSGQTWSFTGNTINASDGNNSSGGGEMGPFPDFVSIGDTVSGASVACGSYSTVKANIGSYSKTCN